MAKDTENGRTQQGLYYDQLRVLMARLSPESAKAVAGIGNNPERVNEIRATRGADVRGLAVDRSRNFNASMEKLMATAERLADMHLAEPIERFALALSQLDAHDIQNILNGVKEGAEGLKLILAAFVGAKGLDMIKSINIKGGGTIMMSVAVGKFVIDYLAKEANEKQDKIDYMNKDSREIIEEILLMPLQKYLSETGQGTLDHKLIADLYSRVEMWNKQGLNQDPQDLIVAAGSWLQENAGAKSHQMLVNANDSNFAWPSNRLDYFSPEKNLDIINRGRFDFKEGFDKVAAVEELAKAINIKSVIKDQLESIEFKKQQVDVKIDVRSEKGLQTTAISKESTVKEKLGDTGGGQP